PAQPGGQSGGEVELVLDDEQSHSRRRIAWSREVGSGWHCPVHTGLRPTPDSAARSRIANPPPSLASARRIEPVLDDGLHIGGRPRLPGTVRAGEGARGE